MQAKRKMEGKPYYEKGKKQDPGRMERIHRKAKMQWIRQKLFFPILYGPETYALISGI